MKKNLVLSGPSNLFSQKLGFGNPDLSCTIIEFKKQTFFTSTEPLWGQNQIGWCAIVFLLKKKQPHLDDDDNITYFSWRST